MTANFETLLKKSRHSLTSERKKLFNLLKKQASPISMNELVEQAEPDIDRSTVYRTIDLFEKLSITQRVYSGWKYRIELSDLFSDHHHHITCTECGKVSTFYEPEELDTMLDDIGATNGFAIKSHSLELQGLCANCRSNRSE